MKKGKYRSHITSTILECGYNVHALSSGTVRRFPVSALTSESVTPKGCVFCLCMHVRIVSVMNAMLPFVLLRLRII